MRGQTSGRDRRGMVLWIVIIVVAFSAMLVYNLTMLAQGEIRLLGRTEWLVRCEIASRSVYQEMIQELRLKPWEKRSFRSGAKTRRGSWSDGVRWQALIEDAPGTDHTADIWIRTDLYEATRVVFYRIEVNTSLFQKMYEIKPTFVSFLDAEQYGNSGTRGAIRDHVDEVLKLREGKREERRKLARHIQNRMDFGGIMGELGLPVIGDVPALQEPMAPGASVGYTLPPLDLAFEDMPEDPLLTRGALSVESFQTVGVETPLAAELVECLKAQLGDERAVRVLDAIQRVRIGLPPGDDLMASADADLVGDGELEGNVVAAMMRAIRSKQKEIVRNVRMIEMMKRLAAMQARMDEIMTQLARAMKGEKGIDVRALEAELGVLQRTDVTRNIDADDLMDHLDFTTESGAKIDVGAMELDGEERKEISEKVGEIVEAVAPQIEPAAAGGGKDDEKGPAAPPLTELEQEVASQLKTMDGMKSSAQELAGRLSEYQKTDETGNPYIDLKNASAEDIAGLKSEWNELVSGRESFEESFSAWRDNVQIKSAGDAIAVGLSDWAKSVFDEDFGSVADSASGFFSRYDSWLSGSTPAADGLADAGTSLTGGGGSSLGNGSSFPSLEGGGSDPGSVSSGGDSGPADPSPPPSSGGDSGPADSSPPSPSGGGGGDSDGGGGGGDSGDGGGSE